MYESQIILGSRWTKSSVKISSDSMVAILGILVCCPQGSYVEEGAMGVQYL